MGALRAQSKVNIREWAGGRKQKPVRRPEWPPKRLRGLFGIQGEGVECSRGLEGRYRLVLQSYGASRMFTYVMDPLI